MTPIHSAVKQLQAERTEKERRRQERAEKAYDPANVLIVTGLALEGCTQKEIAEAFNVSEATISRWKKAHPEFEKALQVGKRAIVGKLRGVGLQRAMGEYVQENQVLQFDKDSQELKVVTTQNKLPPSEKLLCYFLDKLDPQEEQSGLEGIDINLRVLGGADA